MRVAAYVVGLVVVWLGAYAVAGAFVASGATLVLGTVIGAAVAFAAIR